MSSRRIIDTTVRRCFPHPVAAAWHRVVAAPSDGDRNPLLQAHLEVLLRTTAVLLLPDYLRGPSDPAVDTTLGELGRPSHGRWVELIRGLVNALAARGAPEPFAPEALSWFLAGSRQSPEAARLNRCVELRNDLAHRFDPSLVEELHEQSRLLLTGLRWLGGYRFFRLLEQEPLRRGGARGLVQVYSGAEALPEPRPIRWDARLLSGAVYVASPAGDAVLEASPLVEVRHDPRVRQDGLFLVQAIHRGKELVLQNDGTGSEIRTGVNTDESQIPFDIWLSRREEHTPWQANRDPEGGLRAPEWALGDDVHEVLDDRFEVIELLGEGGMAQVYRVHDRMFDREIALKVLRSALSDDEEFRERFRREALTMRDLRHENILQIVDYGRLEGGRLFIGMNVAEQGTLKERIAAPGLPPDQVRELAIPMLAALGHVHDRGMVHRDVKPSNFLVGADGEVLLGDFGIALRPGDQRLTRTLERLGTLAYAPRELRLGQDLTDRSDIYSLALVLHALFTGEEIPENPGQGIDTPLGDLIREMGAPDPANRPSAAEALVRLRETGRAAADEPGEGPRRAPSDEPPAATVRRTRGRRWPWLLAGALLLTALSAGLVVPRISRTPSENPAQEKEAAAPASAQDVVPTLWIPAGDNNELRSISADARDAVSMPNWTGYYVDLAGEPGTRLRWSERSGSLGVHLSNTQATPAQVFWCRCMDGCAAAETTSCFDLVAESDSNQIRNDEERGVGPLALMSQERVRQLPQDDIRQKIAQVAPPGTHLLRVLVGCDDAPPSREASCGADGSVHELEWTVE